MANIKEGDNIKKIILNKIPLNEDGRPLLAWDMIIEFHKEIARVLGEEYIVITSPMEMQEIDKDGVVITIDCQPYTYDDLMAMINSKKEI